MVTFTEDIVIEKLHFFVQCIIGNWRNHALPIAIIDDVCGL